MEGSLLWHGERSVKRHSKTYHIFKVTVKKPVRRGCMHALAATTDGASDLSIHSPDTDVIVLAIRQYSAMCPNTLIVTGAQIIDLLLSYTQF